MEERLKELRKSLNLTQKDFGLKLGVGSTAISRIEKKENRLSERMILSICTVFNVHYDWLVDGTGDMFINLSNIMIDEISEEYNLDCEDRDILVRYLELSPEDRAVLKKFIKIISSSN